MTPNILASLTRLYPPYEKEKESEAVKERRLKAIDREFLRGVKHV